MDSTDPNEKIDIWAVGCLLMGLYTGSHLFPTKDEIEHLAMIERMCGPIPLEMAKNSDKSDLFHFTKYTESEI